MKRIDLILICIISATILLTASSFQDVPGYMDADYYYMGALNLISGHGFQESILWNYLDEPQGIPHPSHTYWMPLPSILSAFGMGLVGRTDYFSARWIFIVIASCIPALAAIYGFQFTRKRLAGWISAGFAIFSGFYLIYLGLVETFGLTMLMGGAWLFLSFSGALSTKKALLLGVLAGLLHMSRADGILWVFFSWLVAGVNSRKENKFLIKKFFWIGIAITTGYILTTGLWYFRNITEMGSLFPPGNNRALWMVEYNQMFSYPLDILNFNNWIGFGFVGLLKIRWDAILSNLQTMLAVQGQIFLLPLTLIGGWRMRKEPLVRMGLFIWLSIFLLMTVVFPLAGSRGGFFHSGAALQPLIWGLAPLGLITVIEFGIRKLKWKMERALPGFGLILIFIAALMSLGLFWMRVIGEDAGQLVWQKSHQAYQNVEKELVRIGAEEKDIVMVNNPPGYFLANGRSAIVIPSGDEKPLLDAARKFGADFLVLDENIVPELNALYNDPKDRQGLKYVDKIEDFHLYRFIP